MNAATLIQCQKIGPFPLILMGGWSTGFFFAVVNRMQDRLLRRTAPDAASAAIAP